MRLQPLSARSAVGRGLISVVIILILVVGGAFVYLSYFGGGSGSNSSSSSSSHSSSSTQTPTGTTTITTQTGSSTSQTPTGTTTSATTGTATTSSSSTNTGGLGPASVNLGTAGSFVILSKSGITDVPTSAITGNVGTSPISGSADHLTCAEVTGTIYSVDAAGPAPCSMVDATRLTTAVGDMQTAYTDAATRSNPDFLNLGAGNIGGLTLAPGLYHWGTDLTIPTDVTISGGPNAVWIFQISGNLIVSNGVTVHLSGGAQAKNIFWQVAGQATLGTTSHFEGIILSQTAINMQTGASINGILLAQTQVTLQSNAVTKSAP